MKYLSFIAILAPLIFACNPTGASDASLDAHLNDSAIAHANDSAISDTTDSELNALDGSASSDAGSEDRPGRDTAVGDSYYVRPDAYREDIDCVAHCVDDYTVIVCSTEGFPVTLHCPSDYHCWDAQCVPNTDSN